MPEWAHLDFLVRRSCNQAKATVSRQTQGDVSLTGFEFVGTAGSKLTIEKDIAGSVGGEYTRSVDSRQSNITRGPNVCPHQFSLEVGHSNLAAASFQIHRRTHRHLNLKVRVADIALAAIVIGDIDNYAGIRLARIKRSFPALHISRDANLITIPGFHGDGS